MPNSGAGLEDALHTKFAGTTEGMTLQVLAQIRDSLTAQHRDIRTLSDAIGDVRERTIRLEERDKRLDHAEADIEALNGKVAVLMKDKDRRDGAFGMLGTIKAWAPFLTLLFSAACVLWLYGRSAGFVPAPPPPPVKHEATAHPEARRAEDIVGGRP